MKKSILYIFAIICLIATLWILIWMTYFKIPSVEILDLHWPKDTNDIQKMFGKPDKIINSFDYLIKYRFENEIDLDKSESYVYTSQLDTWKVECCFIVESNKLSGISIAIFKSFKPNELARTMNVELNNFVKKCGSVVLEIDKNIILKRVGYKRDLIKPSTLFGESSNAGLLVKDKGVNFSREFILPHLKVNDQFEVNIFISELNK